jgi:hypothetical protein
VGEHAGTFWREQAEARQAIEQAIIRDAGHGDDDAPEALRLAAASIAQAALVQQSAFARLVESGGPLTARGRTRKAFSVWQAASDRLERGLRLVGTSRKARPVDPHDAIRAAVEAANRS